MVRLLYCILIVYLEFMKIIFTFSLIISAFFSYGQNIKEKNTLFEKRAKERVKELLTSKHSKPFYGAIIKSKETAIAIAEPILFDIYGKDNIIGERPYKVALTNGYWFMEGTLPEGMLGGCFELVITAKDARVIFLDHYK